MVTENIRKQLCDFKRQGIDLKYCISYLFSMIRNEYNLIEVIIVELKNVGFNESDIFECLENDFGFKVNKIRQSR